MNEIQSLADPPTRPTHPLAVGRLRAAAVEGLVVRPVAHKAAGVVAEIHGPVLGPQPPRLF